ncbi:MAG: ATPase [Gammaproteobacteria bacterium]|nr:ATPase [Gammaproteobacteria bacterium]MCP5409996.1 ATPase [Chromatiaceae bacterium]MCP5443233.1 ATPase [Chromatiaceae bacterium]
MDEALKRLLEAEVRAETIARQADEAREHLIQSALMEARAEENRFELRIPELYAAFLEKAEARANQTNSEMKRRYDERHTRLRNMAEAREEEALDAAFSLLIDPDSDG